MLVVVAGIIHHKNQVLIAQREERDHQGLKWEFPGGKLEEGEEPKVGLIREIQEELGIEIEVEDIFEVVYHRYREETILLLGYMARYVTGAPRALECHDYKWVSLDELKRYDYSEADVEIREKLIKKGLPKKG